MSYRVIQWATGSIGRVSLRHVIDAPDLELVGLKVHDPAKVGRDAGDLVHRPRTGILGTSDIRDIVKLDADVVLHVPINGSSPDEHVDDLEQLLRSGKNVITTVGFTYPQAADADRARRLEKAAVEGGATLFGTGINPGLVAERLALTATSICTEIEHLSIREIYDCSPVASAGFVFDLCGFGLAEAEFWAASAGRAVFFESLFSEVLGFLVDRMNLPADRIRPDHAVALAPIDVAVAAGTIAEGGVTAVRWQWHAVTQDTPVISLRMIWRAGPALPGWEGEDGWQVRIDGSPRVELDLKVLDPVGRPEKSKAIQYAVAGPVVRSIPDVCAAAPGLLFPPAFAAYRSPHRR